ncbi:MAG: hypothetical protein CSA65_09750 [Proteobacteria bacterium]|nr:MAG: hypothetical protein CSB49_06380 [Pseudomonadota bacterium]PIE17068.1 MAG: hypothetical protein CSA65_09750 [Pseudomonadota bacterium]
MYEREIAERAALLLRLGYSADETRARLSQTVAWDFELHTTPEVLGKVDSILGKVDSIVKTVYTRRGVGAGAPSV